MKTRGSHVPYYCHRPGRPLKIRRERSLISGQEFLHSLLVVAPGCKLLSTANTLPLPCERRAGRETLFIILYSIQDQNHLIVLTLK